MRRDSLVVTASNYVGTRDYTPPTGRSFGVRYALRIKQVKSKVDLPLDDSQPVSIRRRTRSGNRS